MALPKKYVKQIKVVCNDDTYDIYEALRNKSIVIMPQEEYDKLCTFYNTYKDIIDKIRNEGVY